MMSEVWQNGYITLYLGDCLEIIPTLAAGSVDTILTDPPYGTTMLEFDQKKTEWDKLWPIIRSVRKENAVGIYFSAQPFTTDFINSNRCEYRYELIWCKSRASAFFDANKRPLQAHENILIFAPTLHGKGNKKTSTYNPQFTKGKPYIRKSRGVYGERGNRMQHYNSISDPFMPTVNEDGRRYPRTWLEFRNGNYKSAHPTQKPLDLITWLVRTYSNPNDLVLDPFMGSGTTGVACVQTGRKFIGIEIERKYFETAVKRIKQAQLQMRMDL